MLPLKILAAVGTIEIQPIQTVDVVGDGDGAEHHRPVRTRRAAPLSALPYSSLLSGESVPPKSVWPPKKSLIPAPEPLGV